MIVDELNIVHKAQQGDAEAFARLVEAYQGPVYRLALGMGLSPHDAEEVAQEAFVAAWRGLPNFRGDSRFFTWLYQLTHHAAVDFLRREKRHENTVELAERPEINDEENQPEQIMEKHGDREAVAAAMQELTPEYREILLLRYMQELDYDEIATVLKLPAGTVKSRLNRAKAQLKEILLRQGNIFGGDAVLSPGKEDESHER